MYSHISKIKLEFYLKQPIHMQQLAKYHLVTKVQNYIIYTRTSMCEVMMRPLFHNSHILALIRNSRRCRSIIKYPFVVIVNGDRQNLQITKLIWYLLIN